MQVTRSGAASAIARATDEPHEWSHHRGRADVSLLHECEDELSLRLRGE